MALSKTKNCVVYLTTQHSPARSLNWHSLDTSLHHAAKSLVFCKLQSYGASSQEGLPCTDFSPPHRKILRPIKMVFDDILPARHQTDETLTRLTQSTHLYKCHATSFMRTHDLWYNRLGKVSNFTGSNALFSIIECEFTFFDFSRIKILL